VAFVAKLVGVERDGLRIGVIVEYHDDVSGWTHPESFSFARGDILTFAMVTDEIRRVGEQYKAAVAREAALQQNVGSEIVI
jgi:hypothetical protein